MKASVMFNGRDLSDTADAKLGITIEEVFESSIRAMKAFSQPGVSFTEEQKAMIQAYVGNDEAAKAVELILEEFNQVFSDQTSEDLKKALDHELSDTREYVPETPQQDGMVTYRVQEFLTPHGWVERGYYV